MPPPSRDYERGRDEPYKRLPNEAGGDDFPSDSARETAEALVAERAACRVSRDYQRADQIRDELRRAPHFVYISDKDRTWRRCSGAPPAGDRERPPRRDVLLAGGDTNCFALDRDRQARDLVDMLRPLRRAGARDAHARAPADTHFFARTTESGIGHRLARLAGAVGVDAPRRYDVLAAAARVVAAGYLHTPESDHDGAWAALEY